MSRRSWIAEPDDGPACKWCGAGPGEFGHSSMLIDDLHPECSPEYHGSVWADTPTGRHPESPASDDEVADNGQA